jgi:hypothetical protein
VSFVSCDDRINFSLQEELTKRVVVGFDNFLHEIVTNGVQS